VGEITRLVVEVPEGSRATEFYGEVARMLVKRGQPPVFTMAVLNDLYAELGDWGAVWLWVKHAATLLRKPLICNVAGNGISKTVLVAPPGWTQERLRGYTAGFRTEIEAAFGPVAGFER
jgi:hypothetical protein